MFGGRNQAVDDLKSKGLVKWINKLFRFVLFPFIYPVKFVVILLILTVFVVAIPLYYGVQIKEVPSWYLQLWNKYYRHVEMIVQDNLFLPVRDKVVDIQDSIGYDVTVKAVERKPSRKDMVSYATPQSVNRKSFEKAQEIPIDVKATLREEAKGGSGVEQLSSSVVFKPIKGVRLSYLDKPKELFGKAVVLNPNEIMINGTVVFLYGIYTSPTSEQGKAAVHYLKESIEGREINCWIGAYTKDMEPTAICIYDGVSINQKLVDMKFSKNVGLN